MLEVRSVSKSFRGRCVLQDVSLSCESGQVVGLRGPNGSGKTMLMRVIAGLVRPTAGEVRVDGAVIGRDVSFPPDLGLLLETPAFLGGYSGMGNLLMLLRLRGERPVPGGAALARDALVRVGLDPDDRRPFRKYSLGMKERLGIAAAVMGSPRLIILDEPTNALDEEGVERCGEIILEERRRGALVIWSCHDGALMGELSDVVYALEEGRISRVEAMRS